MFRQLGKQSKQLLKDTTKKNVVGVHVPSMKTDATLKKNQLTCQINVAPSTTFSYSTQTTEKPNQTEEENDVQVREVESNEDEKHIHGFSLQKKVYVPSYNFYSYIYKHDKTGAIFYHIDAKKDQNNTFSVTFPTIPENSNGVAHVLEHSTLCGSKKFPVRDLFFNMTKRSLNTYMNAWTAPDMTSYPFATQNEADFKNLMEVYMDAVFFPRLSRNDFLQEGHRLEYQVKKEDGELKEIEEDEEVDVDDGILMRSGVVYNEMKGAMSDSIDYYFHAMTEGLLPGTTYANNSGGDPKDIPSLTYDYLKNFHQMHYHPSNAHFYSYGSFDMRPQMKQIDEVISQFEALDTSPIFEKIGKLEKFESPKRKTIYGPPDPMADVDSVKYSINYLCDYDPNDQYEQFAISFFRYLIFDEPRGILYKKIILNGLAPNFLPMGFDSTIKFPYFHIGVQGITEDKTEVIEKAILEAFDEVMENGVETSLIDSVFHSVELSLKKKSPSFGINISHSVAISLCNGKDPNDGFNIMTNLNRARKEIEEGTFFKRIINTYFKNNPHTLYLTMKHNPNHTESLKEEESKQLKQIEEDLSVEDRISIIKENKALKASQNEISDVSTLPTVTINDISEERPRKVKFVKNFREDKTLYQNVEDTNGIVYVTASYDLHSEQIPDHLLPYLNLFSSFLTTIGTTTKNYHKLAEQTELYTAGIEGGVGIISSLEEIEPEHYRFVINSACLDRNVDNMIDLMLDIYHNAKFEEDAEVMQYMKTIVDQSVMEISNSIVQSGTKYAAVLAQSSLSHANEVHEKLNGLSGLQFLKGLSALETFDHIEPLKELANIVLAPSNLRVLVTATKGAMNSTSEKISTKLMDTMLASKQKTYDDYMHIDPVFNPKSKSVHVEIPSNVNFIAQSVPTVTYTHQDSVPLNLLGSVLGSNYLHQQIREQGGAYGAYASQSRSGTFTFYSYRDPQLFDSLSIFDTVYDWISKKDTFTEDMLREAKFNMFQSIDSPVGPHVSAKYQFLDDISNDLIQRRRSQFLSTTRDDILRVAELYLRQPTHRSVCVLGPNPGELDDEVWERVNI